MGPQNIGKFGVAQLLPELGFSHPEQRQGASKRRVRAAELDFRNGPRRCGKQHAEAQTHQECVHPLSIGAGEPS